MRYFYSYCFIIPLAQKLVRKYYVAKKIALWDSKLKFLRATDNCIGMKRETLGGLLVRLIRVLFNPKFRHTVSLIMGNNFLESSKGFSLKYKLWLSFDKLHNYTPCQMGLTFVGLSDHDKFQLKTMDRCTDIGLKIIISYILLLIFKQFICVYISDVVLYILI